MACRTVWEEMMPVIMQAIIMNATQCTGTDHSNDNIGACPSTFSSTSEWKYHRGVICSIPQYGYIQDRPALWQSSTYMTLTWPERLGRGGVGQTLSEHVVQQYCQAAVHPHGAMGWTHFPQSKPEGMP